ncbi:MAG: adenylate kinase [Rhodobiaceae bacterium]|nr:MAG: adenylate kinase [Rhodobiaceae bacterium]
MLVGICGPKGSGKSFAADHLVAKGYARVRFADPLKRMVSALLHDMGISALVVRQHVYGDLKDTPLGLEGMESLTSRDLQVTLGTEWGRQIVDPDWWVKIANLKVKKFLADGRDVVIDDLRFENEARLINGIGGRIIEINRPGHEYDASHPSEAGVPRKYIRSSADNHHKFASSFYQEVTSLLTGMS